MRPIYLCGHTGSQNRGCEAILRSTASVLKQTGAGKINAFTFDLAYDQSLRLDEALNLIPYPEKSFPIRVYSYIKRRIFKDPLWGHRVLYHKVFQRMEQNAIAFNVGGDTYCSKTPYLSYAFNALAKERNIPSIFWGCSVDERVLQDVEMQEDIRRYTHVVTREAATYQNITTGVAGHPNVWQVCDPAFHLDIEETELPEGFIPKNTVGINLSPYVFSNFHDGNDLMYQNVRCLMDDILEKTDMCICLIPHVYCVATASEDLQVLDRLYADYRENPRVTLVRKELSCTQLKYIISKCRFFIGARTHSTIAAYSTAVPAMVLSYSIKSVGIAMDLFGTSEGYALPWKTLCHKTDLKDAFRRVLLQNESAIHERYSQILPAYKQSILDAAEKILEELECL